MKTQHTLIALTAVLLALAACGEDVKPPPVEQNNGTNNGTNNGDPNNGDPNNGDPNNGDPGNNGDNNGQVIDLDPDGPVEIHLGLDPVRTIYTPGINVLPRATVYNGRGQILEDVELAWAIEPATAGELLETGRFGLREEGQLRILACTEIAGREEPLCGAVSFIVDAGLPTIEITEPRGGAELDAADGELIEVRGRVTDTHGVVRAYLDGQPLELAQDGSFETSVVPRFGVNHIEVVASDSLNVGESLVAVDVMWAQRYHPVDLTDGIDVRFDDGMFVRLGQDFFDDREALEIRDPAAVVTDDLAGVVELLIHEIDFLAQLPNPLVESDTITLRMVDFEIREPTVLADISDEGIELYIRLGGMRVTTEGFFDFQNERLDLSGGLSATVAAFATIRFQKGGFGQPYDVQISEFELALEDATSRFVSGEANAVFDLADSALRRLIESELLGGLVDGFLNSVPEILVGALQELESAIDGQEIGFDSGFGNGITARLEAEMGTVDAVNAWHILGTMRTAITSDAQPFYPDSRGVASIVDEGVEPVFFSSSRFQTGLRLAMINGLLHTLWQGGVLDLNILDALPPELAFVTSAARTRALLPPVLLPPSSHDAPWDLELHVGQFEIEAELNDRVDTYAFNIVVGVHLLISDGGLRIDVEERPIITAWAVGSDHEDGVFFDPNGLANLVLTEIWPGLAESLRGALDIELPNAEIDQLGEIAPTLSDFEISFGLSDEATLESGYLIFDGNLRGTADITQ